MNLPVKTTPYQHQVEAFARSIKHRGYGLLMDVGTGKTLVAIANLGYHYLKGDVKNALVIAPLTMTGEWPKEFKKHANFPYTIKRLVGKSREEIKRVISFGGGSGLRVYIINYDILGDRFDELCGAFDAVVADEFHYIKNRTSLRSRATRAIAHQAKYRLGLTATPDDHYSDYWAECDFIKPGFLGTWKSFCNRYFRKGGFTGFQLFPIKNLIPILARKVSQISYYISADDALDLPPFVDETIEFDLDSEGNRVYQEMADEFVAQVQDDLVVAPIVLAQMTRLQQITGGFITVTHEDGFKETRWLHDCKINALREFLYGVPKGKKVVIFAKFIPEIEHICKLLDVMGRPYLTITGAVKNRSAVVDTFQNSNNINTIVLQIATGGEGITLTSAYIAVYYSKTHSSIRYIQSRGRIRRIGQNHECTYVHLIARGPKGKTIDHGIEQVLKDKGDLAALAYNILKEESSMPANLEELKKRLEQLKRKVEEANGAEPEEIKEDELPEVHRIQRAAADAPQKPKAGIPPDKIVSLKELCAEAKIEPRLARKRLRGAKEIGRLGGQWEWEVGSDDHLKVRRLLGLK